MRSITTPSMNECVVSGRSPDPGARPAHAESDKTNPPAKVAVHRASQVGEKRSERSQCLGAEAPKATRTKPAGPLQDRLQPARIDKDGEFPLFVPPAATRSAEFELCRLFRGQRFIRFTARRMNDKKGERKQNGGFERLPGLHRVCRHSCVRGAEPTRKAVARPGGGCV